jgi:phosphoribosylamine---glycine ligase
LKVLVFDNDGEGAGVDISLRAQDAGHDVRYWVPEERPYGKGMLDKPKEWEPSMDWAELVIMIGNSNYQGKMAEYFGKGYPIFGTNMKAAELETEREVGQRVLDEHGIDTLPYVVATNLDEAIDTVVKTKKAYVFKPWGGESNKAMTFVSHSPDDALFTLLRWKKEGLKGQLMLQEKVDGIEIGVSAFFGPGGWSAAIEESFEHKKFLVGDLGENTGEMGTVIRHVKESKLFDMLLSPLEDYLHLCRYVGDCSINCIIDKRGKPWPLEFTMRLGWPDFCIRQAVIEGDPVRWMADLLSGRDSLEVSKDIALGVVMTHGDFPRGGPNDSRPKDPEGTWAGYPIEGVSMDNRSAIHWQQVMDAEAPFLENGNIVRTRTTVTAGNYWAVCSGTGRTVSAACEAAYATVRDLRIPSNVMYRTDIGARLEEQLPVLHKHGYAVGMKF